MYNSELLNSTKNALLGSYSDEYLDLDDDNEATMENWGDITDDEDEYEDSVDGVGLFDEDDMREIEIEASTIEDPDEYIDDALREFSDESMALVGEMYIDELVAEDAILLCESYEDLEAIEEAFKDTVKEKAGKAKKQIMDLAKKFKAWIMNLLNVIVNLFRSGEGLVNKYQTKIKDEYNKRGDKIKVKTYKYHHNQGALQELCESIKKTASGLSQSRSEGNSFTKSEMRSAYGNNTGQKETGASGGSSKDIKRKAIAIIREGNEKKEMTVHDIDINDIIDLAGNKKKYIKDIKDVDKKMQDWFKGEIKKIKDVQPSSSDKEGKKKEKETAKDRIAVVKMGAGLVKSAVSAYIGQLKAANRAYTAIVRKLLNQSTAGGKTETKLMKKIRNK